MTFKFESNSFCSNMTYLTAETALTLSVRSDRHSSLGSDVLHYAAIAWEFPPFRYHYIQI